MEFSIRSSVCRLCLCSDNSLASIFEDRVADRYNIASLLGELLQFEVSEIDGYPKLICSSCIKTITDFKTFKEGCLEAMATYDTLTRLLGNGSIHQLLQSGTKEQPEQIPDHSSTLQIEASANKEPTPEVNFKNLEDTGDQSIISGLEINFDESSASTSRESVKGASCNSSMDKYNEDVKTVAIQEGETYIPELRALMKKLDGSMKENGEEDTVYLKTNEGISCESTVDKVAFRCNFCVMEFQEKESLAKHITSHRLSTCSLAKSSVNDNCKPKKNSKLRIGKTHNCRLCGKVFKRKTNLTRHERIHTKEQPYKCEYCERCFSLSGNLVRHLRTHTNEKPHKCKFCEKCFVQSCQLKEHERTHTKEKPYKCKFCGKGFSSNSNLIVHERIHTEEKRFACQFCGKRFIIRSSCKIHERIHTKEKPYKCCHCEKGFTQHQHLLVHLITHENDEPK